MSEEAPADIAAHGRVVERIRFDEIDIDLVGRRAWLDGEPLSLRNKALEVLACIALAAPRPISKRELLQRVWLGEARSEAVVTGCVRDVRRAFEVRGRRCPIRTVYRAGYRLAGPAETVRTELGSASRSPTREARRRYLEAVHLIRHQEFGRMQEARDKLDQAVRLSPNFFEAQLLLGEYEAIEGDVSGFDGSRSRLVRARELAPTEVDAACCEMKIAQLQYLFRGGITEFEESLRGLVDRFPSDPRLVRRYAELLVESGSFRVGYTFALRALELDLQRGWYVVGNALAGLGDLAGAARAYGVARAHSDERFHASWKLILAKQAMGDFDGARPDIERAQHDYGDTFPIEQAARLNRLHHEGRSVEASRIVATTRFDLMNAALAHCEIGDLERGVALFRKLESRHQHHRLPIHVALRPRVRAGLEAFSAYRVWLESIDHDARSRARRDAAAGRLARKVGIEGSA